MDNDQSFFFWVREGHNNTSDPHVALEDHTNASFSSIFDHDMRLVLTKYIVGSLRFFYLNSVKEISNVTTIQESRQKYDIMYSLSYSYVE